MNKRVSRDTSPVIDKWLSAAEGAVTPQAIDGRDVRCDFCREIIEPGETLTSYLADGLVTDSEEHEPDFPPFHALRAYCSACHRRELLDPCHGYTELLLESEIDEQRCLRNFDIADVSTANEGVPYDPLELWNLGHDSASFDEFLDALADMQGYRVRIGPADIADDYRLHDIDARDLYDDAGNIDVSDEERKEIQQKLNPS